MEVGDPAPGAEGRSAWLGLAVIASPLAWALALFALYGITSHNCFPGSAPRVAGLWNAEWMLVAIAGAALAICIVSGLVSGWAWRRSYAENPQAKSLVQFGEGRTRFLAVWGALTSLLFALLLAVSLVPLFVVPSC